MQIKETYDSGTAVEINQSYRYKEAREWKPLKEESKIGALEMVTNSA